MQDLSERSETYHQDVAIQSDRKSLFMPISLEKVEDSFDNQYGDQLQEERQEEQEQDSSPEISDDRFDLHDITNNGYYGLPSFHMIAKEILRVNIVNEKSRIDDYIQRLDQYVDENLNHFLEVVRDAPGVLFYLRDCPTDPNLIKKHQNSPHLKIAMQVHNHFYARLTRALKTNETKELLPASSTCRYVTGDLRDYWDKLKPIKLSSPNRVDSSALMIEYDLQKHPTLCVSASCGMGKTVQVEKALKDLLAVNPNLRVLVVTFRISQVDVMTCHDVV